MIKCHFTDPVELPLSIPFLPTFHPDELLYSVVARYARWSQQSTLKVNAILFGPKPLRFAYDLPLQVGRLIRTVGPELKLTAEDIVQRHTLLPYYTALHDRAAYERFSKQMIAGQQIHRAVKAPNSATPWPGRLRYCPACDENNRFRYGVPIWLRRHQLVTSLICIEHGGILLDSDVDIAGGRDPRYKAASEPRADARAVAFPWSDQAMSQYRAITAFGHAMLDSQDDPDRWWPAQDLRSLARQKGFDSGTQLDMEGLIAEFDHYYADIFQIWPRLQSFERGTGLHWLYHLLTGSKFTKNPVCRGLITVFLESRDDDSGPDESTRVAYKTSPRPARPDIRTQARAAEDDLAIAQNIYAAAERLRREKPPTRVTKSKLIRKVPGLHSLLMQYQLPLTNAALSEEVETSETFTPRRLTWIFEQARANGIVSLADILATGTLRDSKELRTEWRRYCESSELERTLQSRPSDGMPSKPDQIC